MPELVIRDYREGFAALDTLHAALGYIKKQYSDGMTRDVAQAHFDARAIILNRENALLNEMELTYFYEPQMKE